MSKFYSLEDVRSDEFYQLPKDLIKNPKYKTLSPNAKIAYAILKDRHQVSLKNEWIDEIGVYFLLSDSELAEILDTTIRSASRYKNDLQNFGLIHMERQGMNKRNKIYLLKPEYEPIEKNTIKPLAIADRTILSSPDRTELSNHDRTILSSPDRTELSNYSNNDFSNNDFSNIKNKEEEEERESQLEELYSLFSNNISKINKAIKKELNKWLTILPFEVIKAEIELAALNNAKSWKYVETLLNIDYKNNVRSSDDVNKRVVEFSNKKKSKPSNKKLVRKEIVPEWLDEETYEVKTPKQQEGYDQHKMALIQEKLKQFRS